jgi:hypothetical protein
VNLIIHTTSYRAGYNKVGGAFMLDDAVKSIYTGTSRDCNEVIMFYCAKNTEMVDDMIRILIAIYILKKN